MQNLPYSLNVIYFPSPASEEPSWPRGQVLFEPPVLNPFPCMLQTEGVWYKERGRRPEISGKTDTV